MKIAALGRLLWKDARVLLPLWSVLLAAVLLLQAGLCLSAGWWLGSGAELGNSSSEALAGCVVPWAFCLALCLPALLWTAENEARTDEWLRLLPLRPALSTAAKLGLGLASLAAFIAIGAMTAVGIDRWMFRHFPGSRADSGWFWLTTFGGALLWSLPAFVSALPFAVRQRRVTAAVVSGLGAFFVIVVVASEAGDRVGHWLRRPHLDPVFVGMAFVLAGIVGIGFAWAWAAGRPVWTGRLHRRLGLRGAWSIAGWGRVRQALDWAPVLRRGVVPCATLGRPVGRAVAVLLWQEALASASLVAWWLGLTVLSVALLAFGGVWDRLGVFTLTALLALAPTMFGHRTSHDAAQETPRFLGERGVSPTLVWAARHLASLAGAATAIAWIGVCLELVRLASPTAGNDLRGPVIVEFVSELHGGFWNHFQGTTSAWLEIISASQWSPLAEFAALYAAGQLCGFWFRSRVLSNCLAILFAIPVILWHRLLEFASIPWSLGSWPLTVLWLCATWRLMDVWLTGVSSRSLVIRKATWLLAPCGLTLALVSVGRQMQGAHQPFEPASAKLAEMRRLPTISVEATAAWEDLTARLEHWHAAADEERTELRARLQRFAADRRFEPQSMVHPRATWPYLKRDLQSLQAFVAAEAERLRAAGKLEEELRLYADTVRIGAVLSPGWPMNFPAAVSLRQSIWERVVDWANAPEQSAETLQQGSTAIQSELVNAQWRADLLPHWHAAIVDQLVDRRGEFYELQAAPEGQLSRSAWCFDALLRIAGEHRRARTLAHFTADWADPLASVHDLAGGDWTPGRTIRSVASKLPDASFEEYMRWIMATPPLPGLGPSAMQPARFLQTYFDAAEAFRIESACSRTALLVIALQRHRAVHGSFPERLLDLDDSVPDWARWDPLSEGDFDFFPRGFDLPIYVDSYRSSVVPANVVPSGHPLLWSRGRWARTLSRLRLTGTEFDHLPPEAPRDLIVAGSWGAAESLAGKLAKADSPELLPLLQATTERSREAASTPGSRLQDDPAPRAGTTAAPPGARSATTTLVVLLMHRNDPVVHGLQ